MFTLGDYSSVSAGVKVWCASDDYVRDLVTIIPAGFSAVKENLITGDVTIGHYTAIGANAVIMPSNEIPEGTTIGALSFVPTAFTFEPWMVYAGIPIRRIAARDRDAVLRQRDRFERELAARRESE
jgi:acetyltransferase-like isoleucine patch superfamily enzyme